MSPKNNLRRPPDGRVVGSPKRQFILVFARFPRMVIDRGTEAISSRD
jgi:hypothetical protein